MRAGCALLVGLAIVAPGGAATAQSTDFLRGVDISFMEQYEAAGFAFREAGAEKELIDLMADRGANSVRLRLWHTPPDGHNTTAETLETARRIKARGLHFLLDFHYSDWWADPAQQNKPAAWEDLSFEELTTAVRVYTRNVIRALNDQGTLPDMVQLGNEITPGMLWEAGRVGGSFDTTAQWNQLAALLTAASEGVDEGLDPGQSIEIMIHIDRGGDLAASRWFHDRLRRTGFEFDVIGLSYYPFWHGTLTDVEENLRALESRYRKPLVIVETAYPWTLSWSDGTGNFVGQAEQLLDGYPASIDGQRRYLEDLMRIVREVPNNRGRGVYYWAPARTARAAACQPAAPSGSRHRRRRRWARRRRRLVKPRATCRTSLKVSFQFLDRSCSHKTQSKRQSEGPERIFGSNSLLSQLISAVRRRRKGFPPERACTGRNPVPLRASPVVRATV